MNIRERLNSIIEQKKYTIKEFAEITEIPYRSMYNYVRGEREPSVEALEKIHRLLNVNLNWLLTGEGEVFRQVEPNSLSEQEMVLIQYYQMMTDEAKKVFDVSFKAVAKISLDSAN